MMNKNIGNTCENKLIELLGELGYWCHLFAYKPEGQPCDVVALKNDIGWLIDVKHCQNGRFPFKDIRPNQLSCFALAKELGNSNCGFAIFFEDIGWRWLSYKRYLKLEKAGVRSVVPSDCDYFGAELWN